MRSGLVAHCVPADYGVRQERVPAVVAPERLQTKQGFIGQAPTCWKDAGPAPEPERYYKQL